MRGELRPPVEVILFFGVWNHELKGRHEISGSIFACPLPDTFTASNTSEEFALIVLITEDF
jgi:hypothetical protein